MTGHKINPNMVALTKLIAAHIAKDPFVYDGHSWCALPQQDVASALAISVENIRRLIGKPPIVRDHTHKDGKPIVLLRIGERGPKTKKQVQKHLANIWRSITGKTIVGRQFGHLGGMVDAWGLDKAPDILRLVLKDWSYFMAGVDVAIAKLGDDGYKRFYEYPSTSVILRFNTVAVEMYIMHQQEKHGLNADIGGLWFAS
ncbi:hypothetical protein [Mesorhizobium erdmanii]|nr:MULTISPECIES: hypothetical protein [Mesorhizobium]